MKKAYVISDGTETVPDYHLEGRAAEVTFDSFTDPSDEQLANIAVTDQNKQKIEKEEKTGEEKRRDK